MAQERLAEAPEPGGSPDEAEGQEPAGPVAQPDQPLFVIGEGADCYHVVASASPMDPPGWHHTRCTWHYGLTEGVRRLREPPEGVPLCSRGCGGKRRNRAAQGTGG